MTMVHEAKIGSIRCGGENGLGGPLVLMAGPCVIESEELIMGVAEKMVQVCSKLGIRYIFKASFDKANRTSITSYRGPGLDEGLKALEKVKASFGVPVVTDFHEAGQAQAVAQVCDLLQVPAFLARQTDLLVSAAQTGKAVNVKKGQFMAPGDMKHVVTKLREAGCENILLTERGTTFGYGMLVSDFRSLPTMRSLGVPVVFDATHSVQQPSAAGGVTGGQREMVPPLAKAAMAVGCDALFLETHPTPDQAKSDGPNMVPLDQMEELLSCCIRIRHAAHGQALQAGSVTSVESAA